MCSCVVVDNVRHTCRLLCEVEGLEAELGSQPVALLDGEALLRAAAPRRRLLFFMFSAGLFTFYYECVNIVNEIFEYKLACVLPPKIDISSLLKLILSMFF